MDIEIIDEINATPYEILDNKKEPKEISIQEEIKNEFFEIEEDYFAEPNEGGLYCKKESFEIKKHNEILQLGEEAKEISFKEEIKNEFFEIEEEYFAEPNEGGLYCKKGECRPSNGMKGSLSPYNSNVLMCHRGVNPEKLSYDSNRFKCGSCPYQAKNRETLKIHEWIHKGEKPFKCSSCPYQAIYSQSLKVHERIHTGEKPFKCMSCPYKAAVRSSLYRHERIHTGEKPFKCRSCPYRTAERGDLNKHERIHRSEKSFKCSSCSYQTTWSWHLERHVRIHHLEDYTKQSPRHPTTWLNTG